LDLRVHAVCLVLAGILADKALSALKAPLALKAVKASKVSKATRATLDPWVLVAPSARLALEEFVEKTAAGVCQDGVALKVPVARAEKLAPGDFLVPREAMGCGVLQVRLCCFVCDRWLSHLLSRVSWSARQAWQERQAWQAWQERHAWQERQAR
jgi:hypothetical protein